MTTQHEVLISILCQIWSNWDLPIAQSKSQPLDLQPWHMSFKSFCVSKHAYVDILINDTCSAWDNQFLVTCGILRSYDMTQVMWTLYLIQRIFCQHLCSVLIPSSMLKGFYQKYFTNASQLALMLRHSQPKFKPTSFIGQNEFAELHAKAWNVPWIGELLVDSRTWFVQSASMSCGPCISCWP